MILHLFYLINVQVNGIQFNHKIIMIKNIECKVQNCVDNCCTKLRQCPDHNSPLEGLNSCFYFYTDETKE